MNLRPLLASAVVAALVAASPSADAATCQVAACTTAIQAATGLVVNDIFKDINGKTGDLLPVYGTLINNWPGCPEHADFAGAGHSLPPYDCPGEYTGDATTPTFANANVFLGALDRYWWQPCRLNNPALDVNGCVADWTCIADDVGGNYLPWEGLVFDLGGPSNKVAIFGENDHAPQPCESLEYTVYLSDNPFAHDPTDIVLQPAVTGVDPNKWNRAVLSKIYTGGWTQVRPPDEPGHGAACGDTQFYSVEEDSFVQVFSLPCGITFRYAAIVAGNDGLDFPDCGYNSNEGEIDAVAGLTESGAAVCPDKDNDHYVDCACPGAPPVCDCNDNDPTIHPGAPEACDSPDLNCDGVPGSCAGPNQTCYQSVCLEPCGNGEIGNCPAGSTCQVTPSGKLCVPQSCTTGGCPAGGVCKGGICVPACTGVVCPGVQVCQDGNCIDLCANVLCPAGQTCQGGTCAPPCNCFAGDVGCTSPQVCDTGSTDSCVAPSCKGAGCGAGTTCDPTTGACVGFCNASVVCPAGQKCVEPDGCVSACTGVTCQNGFSCDPATGTCVDQACIGVSCNPPTTCVSGSCVFPDGGFVTSSGSGSMSTSSESGGVGGAGGAGGNGGNGGNGGADPGAKGSCGCRTVGDSDGSPLSPAAALGLLGAVLALARRRTSTRRR